jgi:hypothetical protein
MMIKDKEKYDKKVKDMVDKSAKKLIDSYKINLKY